MAFGASRKDAETQQFRGVGRCRGALGRPHALPRAGRRRDRVDRAHRPGPARLPERSASRPSSTFPIVDGRRLAVPGDRGTLAADGTIVLLGRDSMVVNSGGEKIFVEEVEEAIRRHPDVLDALVVGRPSERFGEEVVALVQLRPGARRDRRRHPRRSRPRTSRASRRRGRCCCATTSRGTRRARPTTAGRSGPRSPRSSSLADHRTRRPDLRPCDDQLLPAR